MYRFREDEDLAKQILKEESDVIQEATDEVHDYLSNSASGTVVSRNMAMKNRRGIQSNMLCTCSFILHSSFCWFKWGDEKPAWNDGAPKTSAWQKDRFSWKRKTISRCPSIANSAYFPSLPWGIEASVFSCTFPNFLVIGNWTSFWLSISSWRHEWF